MLASLWVELGKWSLVKQRYIPVHDIHDILEPELSEPETSEILTTIHVLTGATKTHVRK